MEARPDRRILDKHLVGETIYIGDHGTESIVRCTLQNCHIIVDVPRGGAHIFESQLSECIIETKKTMKNAWFFTSDYTRCKFKGKYSGMDFGRSPIPDTYTGKPDQYGDLIDCDFTEATLDLCRFFSVDIHRQKFAPWPQFVVSAQARTNAWSFQNKWPGEFGVFVGLAEDQDIQLSAVTGTKTDFIKRFKVTDAELEQSLQAIGGVIR